jgi:hypothetical protein
LLCRRKDQRIVLLRWRQALQSVGLISLFLEALIMEGKAERLVNLLEAENPELVAFTVLQLDEVVNTELSLILSSH